MITFGLGSSVPTSTKSSLKNLLPTVFNNAEISSCTVRVVETGSMISLFPAAEPRTPMSFTGTASMGMVRSEEHTSELQSRGHLVCRLLLEKKKKKQKMQPQVRGALAQSSSI